MPVSVTMPRLGESVTEGTVTRWLKQEGDEVSADEPLLEVSTDKVDTEVPSPASGILTSIKVAEDETVEIGVELAVISEAGEASGDAGGGSDSASDDRAGADADSDDGAASDRAGSDDRTASEDRTASADRAEAGDSSEDGAASDDGTASEEGAAADADSDDGAASDDSAGSDDSAPTDTDSDDDDDSASADSAPADAAAADTAQADSTQADSAARPAPAAPAPAAAAPPPAAAPRPAAAAPPAAAAAPAAEVHADDDEIAGTYVTPLVRKLASEHGVDLNALSGTGVGGRIRKSDVLNAANEAARRKAEAEAAPPAPATATAEQAPAAQPAGAEPAQRGRTEKLSRLRQVIAARMVESLRISAQLTTVVEVDVTRIARLRQAAKGDFERREGVKLSFLPFFAIAAVEALKEHPDVNCSVDTEAGTVTYHEAEHLGIAVDTERGLLVPVIHNAGDLNLGGIARKIADLAERTRTNKVSPDELGGGTFTLTNTGSRGALFDTPIINQPQVAILGTGSVVKRPVVISDENLGETIAIRSMVYLALSYDHRIVDGADAARFLGTMKSRLEAGAFERALGLHQG
jgi:pyruvate dehydrogenase E2 component (dihydrolipoamide acetyltransferase)